MNLLSILINTLIEDLKLYKTNQDEDKKEEEYQKVVHALDRAQNLYVALSLLKEDFSDHIKL